MARVIASGTPPAEFRRRVVQRSQQATQRRAEQYGAVLGRSALRVLTRPGTGRVYTWMGRPHRASEPGNPPAPRSRFLAEGAYVVVRPTRQTSATHWSAGVSLNFPAAYAAALDPALVGARPTGRPGERPILAPILRDALPELRRIQRATR